MAKLLEEADNWGKFFAEIYWESEIDASNQQAICEMLVDGQITVVEVVKVLTHYECCAWAPFIGGFT